LVAHDCGLVGNPSHTGIDDIEREYDVALRARLLLYHYGSVADGATLVGRRCRRPRMPVERRRPLSAAEVAGILPALHQPRLGWWEGSACGEVSEWLKEHAWKVCIRLIPVSRVRQIRRNEFGQPQAGPERKRGVRLRTSRTIPPGAG